MSRKLFWSFITLIITVYICCMGQIIYNRVKLNEVEKRLDNVERVIGVSTNNVEVAKQ